MQKENGKRESPYKGILKFADEKKPQLSFAVVLSVLSSAFGIVPYIAVAILLQKALASSLTTIWAILLPVIALCGYLLKHTLDAKSTLCSHKVAYEIIKNIRTTIMKKMSCNPVYKRIFQYISPQSATSDRSMYFRGDFTAYDAGL